MALTRQQKEKTVADIEQNVADATSVVFMAYDGLSISDVNELRDKLFEGGSRMQVIPKRLLRIAMQNQKREFDPTQHEGQVAVIWGSDAVAPAKVIYEFAEDKDNIQLLSGVLENEEITVEQVASLAKLPTREQLLGQLVGVLAGPARGFVTVLSGVPRNMVYVLQAIKDQKEE